MSEFAITADHLDAPDAGDMRCIRIAAGSDVLTRLVRNGHEHGDVLHAPADPLAFWLVDNWWRILFETVPAAGPNPSWRLAHELSSIGGYIWPRMVLWGEGERAGIAVHPEPPPTTLQYLARGIRYVPAADMESGVDRFVRQVLDEDAGDCRALRAEYDALRSEREDPDTREWRIVEAMLGYDVDKVPSALAEKLGSFIERYGEAGIEEAALAKPGEEAAEALDAGIRAASASGVRAKLPVPTDTIAFRRDLGRAPWEMAEEAAASLRSQLCLTGPVRNKRLGDIFDIDPAVFRKSSGSKPPYGLRIRDDGGDGVSRIAFRTVKSPSRRFELCRNVADMIWTGNDALGPVSDAMSARQKFQKAFAQSFLCPYQELLERYGPQPTRQDVPDAAEYFHVSEGAVETLLRNKRHIERDPFMEMVGAL